MVSKRWASKWSFVGLQWVAPAIAVWFASAPLRAETASASNEMAVRRAIAGATPAPPLRPTPADPELAALQQAERSLFSRTLVGFRAGWSWDKVNRGVQERGAPPLSDAIPSAAHPAAADSEWLRSLKMPDFPVRLDDRVVEYLHFYRDSDRGREILKIWARKAGRYVPGLQSELTRAGLPKDLVWVSLIESGHNPTSVSSAGAAGIWQLVPESARSYGLTVDRSLDERLDVRRATEAAAKFLSDLYQRFGSWELALAAYNMGHGGLISSVRKYNTNDFWRLSEYEAAIPWETTLYVPKIVALAIAMNNLRAFGAADVRPDPPIAFETVFLGGGETFQRVADAAGIPLDSLRSMNPEYVRALLPTPEAENRRYPLRVPRGKGVRTLLGLLSQNARQEEQAFVARTGDTLETVAARFRTTPELVAQPNRLRVGEAIAPGWVLRVPRLADGQAPQRDTEEAVVVARTNAPTLGRTRVFYRVVLGDTLDATANALGVTPEELVVWNQLEPGARLQSGIVLQAYVATGREFHQVRLIYEKDTRVLATASSEFFDYFEDQRHRKRLKINAHSGDTLASVGARYGLSVGTMERINRCSRARVLKAGDALIVYAPQDNTKADAALALPREKAPPVNEANVIDLSRLPIGDAAGKRVPKPNEAKAPEAKVRAVSVLGAATRVPTPDARD